MTDETFVQAFWSLAILVGFCGGIFVLAAIIEGSRAARDTFRRVRACERARVRWAEILGPGLKDWDSLFASVKGKNK